MEIIQFLFLPFLVCLTMIGIFSYFGIHVLEREIIFINIALAQIAAVGSTLAFILWGTYEHNIIVYIFAFGFTLLAAIFYSQTGRRITQISQEAIIGVSYAIAAAGALFLLAMAAGGDVHLEDMLTDSIHWVNQKDVIMFYVPFLIIGASHMIFRNRFFMTSQEYPKANQQGIGIS